MRPQLKYNWVTSEWLLFNLCCRCVLVWWGWHGPGLQTPRAPVSLWHQHDEHGEGGACMTVLGLIYIIADYHRDKWCSLVLFSVPPHSIIVSLKFDLVITPVLVPSLIYSPLFFPQTERTMTELEIAVNQRVGEWEVIQESGATLRPLWGPGLTGMKNLGNSCYLNSVMQVLFTVPDFQTK